MTKPQTQSSSLCPVCGEETNRVGDVTSDTSGQRFELRRCDGCTFAYISNPRLDFDQIYTADYYRGLGADPLVDYEAERGNPRTIRRYEWSGILKWVRSVTSVTPDTSWLDYGCGLGGLVTYLRSQGLTGAFGYEPSPHHAADVPVLDSREIENSMGRFDVVTAIEVIEHVPDPVAELRRIRQLLRPGGTLLLTTGNAAPYRERLTTWRYVRPDLHISLFEPDALARALREAGFEAEFPGFTNGWTDIIRYKVLKNLGRHSTHPADNLVPWGPLVRIVDRRYGLSAQPIGRVRADR